ncbi:MAG: hypothetical protein VX777_10250 [Chlamydiota bacterium]|nr:hypothetical protein [Chlamydiota bacterium]
MGFNVNNNYSDNNNLRLPEVNSDNSTNEGAQEANAQLQALTERGRRVLNVALHVQGTRGIERGGFRSLLVPMNRRARPVGEIRDLLFSNRLEEPQVPIVDEEVLESTTHPLKNRVFLYIL